MKNYYFFFLSLSLLFSNLSFSQYLKGRVVDNSNQPLPSASVYYDGTTLSTLTDENGEFTLTYNAKINRPLVVSYVGYQTVYFQDYNAEQTLSVTMEIAMNSLSEVVIKKDIFSRKDKMKIFKERFLGATSFGRKAIIENEDDINFEYDEKAFLLKAYSDKPLIVLNPSLGYKITYELVDFEIKFSYLTISSHGVFQSYYAVLSRYEEVDKSAKSIKNRDKAYKGSNVCFFRNLISGVWSKEEFQLFEKGIRTNPSDHFTVTVEDDKYKVSVKKQEFNYKTPSNLLAVFELLYNKNEQSQVQFNSETIYIGAYGNNLSLRDVTFSGAISLKCVGDMLPLNYGM